MNPLAKLMQAIADMFKPKSQAMLSPLADFKGKPAMAAPKQAAPPAPPKLDTEKYNKDKTFQVKPMPPDLEKRIWEIYGPDKMATQAAVIAGTENPNYNPNATNVNSNGSTDSGYMQVNSNTINDFLRRKPNTMKKIGVSSVDDMRDMVKNLLMGREIMREQGPGAWYGPTNKGYDLTGGE